MDSSSRAGYVSCGVSESIPWFVFQEADIEVPDKPRAEDSEDEELSSLRGARNGEKGEKGEKAGQLKRWWFPMGTSRVTAKRCHQLPPRIMLLLATRQ